MRILFITMPDSPPSTRIRVAEMLPWLRDQGVVAEAVPWPWDPWRQRRIVARAAEADAVVVQKLLMADAELGLLRRHARRLAFDVDDAVHLKPAFPRTDPAAYESSRRRRRFSRMVGVVDLVIAANATLAGEARAVRAEVPVAIVPSAVADDVPCRTDHRLGDPPVVGWVGVGHNLAYLRWAAPALRDVVARHGIRLRVLSDRPLALRGIPVEHRPWRFDTQDAEISRFDVGIMPLSPDPYSAGKAAYKLLQYLAAGVPSVASAVGMNVEVSDGNCNCLMANDMKGISEAVRRLLGDLALRERLARNGRELVRRHYARAVVARRLAAALRALA